MKKIGIIITRMVAGGASNVVRRLIEGGSGSFEFFLLTGPEGIAKDELSDLEAICEIRVIPSLVRSISPIRDFRAYLELRREIRGLELDVVHTHTSKAGVLGRLAAHAERIPRIIHSTHGSIYEPGSEIVGVPSVSMGKWFFLNLERFAGKRSDFLTVLSERERKLCLSLGLESDSKIRVVPNGVDAARFAVAAAARAKARTEMGFDDQAVFLSVGRLSSEKGHSVLLEAFARFAASNPSGGNARLLIVGDGPEMVNLKQLAAKLADIEFDESAMEFGKVRFAGDCRDIRGFLAASDVFVLPSLYEGFGIVLLEAMAAGVPIIASRTGGVPEIVADGEGGLLVDPGDCDALAAAMLRLDSDRKLSASMSEAGKLTVERYSLDRMLSGYFDLY
ncbi:MAG: glycosyltransferase family 4 protein [Victivallales bacterium]|nr:glycosyltransferase family 4 protein [Victivallales bacterium]